MHMSATARHLHVEVIVLVLLVKFWAPCARPQAWTWVNEGKSPLRPKWGYVSEAVGDSLLIKVCRA